MNEPKPSTPEPTDLKSDVASEADASTNPQATPGSTTEGANSDQEQGGEAAASSSSNRNLFLGIGIALFIAAFGYIALFTDTGSNLLASNTVAKVNNEAIGRSELDNSVTDLTAALAAQGIDTSTEDAQSQIETEALSRLINTKLLFQAAVAAGYQIEESTLDEQVGQLATTLGGEEALRSRMEELDLSEAELRDDVREQLLVSQYIEGETNINTLTIDEAAVQAYYDQIVAQAGDQEVPPLEEVAPQIEQQLMLEQQQAVLAETIADLRALAEIEVMI